jgi:hypothetical protein
MVRLAYILIGLGLVTGICTIFSVYFAVRQQDRAARKRFRLQTGDWRYWFWADFVSHPLELYPPIQTFSLFRSIVLEMLAFPLMGRHRKPVEQLRINHPFFED